MRTDSMEDGKSVDFTFQEDYISLHINETAKVMPKQRVRGAISILICVSILSICSQKMIGKPQSENTLVDKMSSGRLHRKRGEFHPAIAAFDEALQMAWRLKDDQNRLECLMQLGVLHWNIGQVEESASIYRRALALSQKIGRKDIEAECAGYIQIYESYLLGKKTRDSGSYRESLEHFNAAINLSREMESLEHELKCLRQMSLVYFHKDNHSNFFFLNSQALNIARRLEHKKEVARCFNNLGIYYCETGSYSRALVFYNDALTKLREIVDSESDLSACLNNIGAVYRVLGEYEKAVPYIKNALEIDSKINDIEGISIELENLALTYRHKGLYNNNINDIDISLDYHAKSLQLSRKNGDKRSEIGTLNNMGLTYSALGKYALALKHFRLAAKEADLVANIYEACNIYNNMGYVFLRIGKLSEAKECFNKALDITRNTGRDDVIWEIHFGLGQCFEKMGNVDYALAYYREAIVAIDKMRSRIALDSYRIGFSRDKLIAHETLANLLLAQNNLHITSRFDRDIFRIIEKAKARSFLEGLDEFSINSPDSRDLGYKKDNELLSNKISKTISHLTKPGLDKAQRKKLLARLETEEEEYTSLLNRIGTQSMENSRQAFPDVVTIDRIRGQCLDQKTAILEYYLGEKRSIGLFLDEKQIVLKALSPRREIEDSLRAYLKMLSEPPDGEFMGIPAAQRIYQDLVSPFEDHISPAIEHLIVVPDGILYYLPFETLVKNNAGNTGPKYLVELYDISYAPSVSSLSYLMGKRRPRKFEKALLAVGGPVYLSRGIGKSGSGEEHDDVLREIFLKDGFDLSPLPHSRKEIGRVVRCFPKDEVDILLGSQAKEESLKGGSLEGYRILHFACHGFLDEKTPMRSALVLTLDDDFEEDGFLQAREISNLKLSADLVVLSACQTAKGRLENTEGVLGLPRAFFYAGARSTISSLWKISDKSASEIMPSFYRHLTENKSKAKALRLAKLEKLQSAQSHPFYWAAFILNGDYTWEAGRQAAISSK